MACGIRQHEVAALTVDHRQQREEHWAIEMQLFVRYYRAMIAAAVQCDVDGISEGSHYTRLLLMGYASPWSMACAIICVQAMHRKPGAWRRSKLLGTAS